MFNFRLAYVKRLNKTEKKFSEAGGLLLDNRECLIRIKTFQYSYIVQLSPSFRLALQTPYIQPSGYHPDTLGTPSRHPQQHLVIHRMTTKFCQAQLELQLQLQLELSLALSSLSQTTHPPQPTEKVKFDLIC